MSTGPFTSSYESRAPTLTELQVELGSENANSLVSKIGELARAHGLGGSQAGMDGAVDRVIGSLTSDERRLMSEGSYVPPRVEAIISAEAETAKAQQRQNEDAARRDGRDPATGPLGRDAAFGRGPLAALWNLPGSDRNGSAAPSDARSGADAGPVFRGNLASVSPQNYSGTPFAASGMSYSTFDSLRAQGFGPTNIIHAAQDARTNGFDPNNKPIAKAFAVLDKDDGARREQRNRLLHDFRERLDHDEEFQNLKAARDKAATPEERAKIDQKMMERGRQISKDVGYHGHIEAAPTKRAKDAGKLIENETIIQKIKNKALEHTHGNRAEADRITSAMDDYRRNPTDAAARHRYDEAVPKSLQAQIRWGLQKDAALRRKTDVAVDKKKERNTEKTARNDEKTAQNEDRQLRLAEKKTEGASLDDEWNAIASAATKPAQQQREAGKPNKDGKSLDQPDGKPDEKGKTKTAETNKETNKKIAAKNNAPKPA